MHMYREDYPRPQFVREQWENLNGEWDFAFDDEREGQKMHWEQSFPVCRKILVPFTYETAKSGIQDTTAHSVVWYNRTFYIENPEAKKNVLLHFEGSDYSTSVYVNEQYAGCHTGGYNRFTFDITDMIKKGENRLTVRVEDSDSVEIPRGKQRWEKNSYGCWYVQTTGIWKTVWTETVPSARIDSIKITPVPSEYSVDMHIDFTGCQDYQNLFSLEAIVSFSGKTICSCTQPV